MTTKARNALDFDPDRATVRPKDAATLMVLRDGDEGLEVFCVRRHAESPFVGGAVVFPGGKLDPSDGAEGISTTALRDRATMLANDETQARALAICACRESLEEAAILPATPSPNAARLEGHQVELNQKQRVFAELLRAEGLTLTLDELRPFGRWVTPEAEQRRFDARFYMTRLPSGQLGRHDARETTSSVWAAPRRVLDGFFSGDLFLVPPTLRCLELLADCEDVDAALALADRQSLLPICPRFVPDDPPRLVLPGDPDHQLSAPRIAGTTRFVLRDERFVSEEA